MKKIISYISENFLFLITVFLLAFIPLYPKLPLFDIKNTWVYIRVEDFLVLGALFAWLIQLVRKKVTLKTPITIPIMVFWIIGAIATIHGVLIIFPTAANVFPNVAFLAFLRHIEYLSLFFVAFASIRDKKQINAAVFIIAFTLLGVIFYGFGQKYLGFPAYLTMNEEFAKGIPITLSQLSRLPSTFAGQYDLAAYLVLVIPIVVSMIFGFKNLFIKAFFAGTALLGFALLFMTVSRVSFFVLLVALFILLFFQKKKLVLYSIPVIAVLAFLFFSFSPALLNRFGNTVKEVDVLVDGKTGAAVGEVNFVPVDYFKDKVVRQERVSDKDELTSAMLGEDSSTASASGVIPFKLLAPLGKVPVVSAANVSNGESLPQGTGYINLPLSPVTKRVGNFFYELAPNVATHAQAEVLVLHGDFIVKRAAAYDLSFTTRFQGEWPHAIMAFERNILFGSGYGSVSLAVDNNYLRTLAEVGALGMASFFAIFIAIGIYIKKILPDIESGVARSFILGFVAGVIGLALNATLIDVFEASKIAYLLWMLTGVTLGTLVLYQKREINLFRELKNVATSTPAVIIYLFILAFVVFSPMLGNYFVADDYTWFRWAATCGNFANGCSSFGSTLLNYFINSDGFFFRPGTKLFFYFMYQAFWLNQVVYHMVSIILHFIVVTLFYLLAQKVLKKKLLAAGAAFLFMIMSGYVEIVFWISATGHLFNAMFILLSLLSFMLWKEKKNMVFFIGSIIFSSLSLLFYELGMVAPLLIILYEWVYGQDFSFKKAIGKIEYLALFIPDLVYLLVRFISGSHWQGGDYSYNLIKLPFNIVGNMIGYVSVTFLGPFALGPYEKLREVLRDNLVIAAVVSVVVVVVAAFLYKKFWRKINIGGRRIITFGFWFFIISLLPFIGFGNITSRYSYLASLGLVIIFVYLLGQLYDFLLSNGREIAVASITVIVSAFALFQIIQVQQVFQDWYGAGQNAQNFLTAIDDAYSDYWSTTPMEFHFINVPTKVGDAWVFPVGMDDAMWFAFKNPHIAIVKDQTLTPQIQNNISRTYKVFQFNGDGSVTEVQPPKKLITPTPSPTLIPLSPTPSPLLRK
ncbi:MAG TPA: hypothetical protein VG917_03785 [Patescibacteria group bacterium]|nr:hypothetical protein [Patescibacteria group bacterium]